MSVPTREELEGWKRPALQQKCKELGIKANSKSEVLIDLLLNHFQSEGEPESGPSQPTTSRKRKAIAAASEPQPADDEQPSDDEVVSAPQRHTSTRRKAAQSSAPPAKVRKLASKIRAKIEPADDTHPSAALASPRHAQIVEVVLSTPSSKMIKGKAKAKESAVKAGPSAEDVKAAEQGAGTGIDAADDDVPVAGTSRRAPRPLEPNPTSVTILDTTPEELQPQLDAHETRIADLELQIRNARKSSDESARDVMALKAFQHAVQQAFGDASSSDTLDNMGQMAKLRDVAPKLIALSGLDSDLLTSRVTSVEEKIADFDSILKRDQNTIAELKERIRELEEGKSAIGDLEVLVRQLQSQFNRIPDSVFESNKPEDSAPERVYTIIRAPSRDVSVAPSSSQQQRPSSRLSVPPEDGLPPQSQDQNTGRSSSIARSIRASRPPLAEKEGVKVGQPDVEVETADPRRSIRRLAESLPSSAENSAPPSRARSTTPNQRESSAVPTPSRGKGKGKMHTKSGTSLDTVDEDEGLGTPEQRLPETAAFPSTADPFTPTAEIPRSPPVFDASRRDSFGSPPPSASKPNPKVPSNQGPVSTFLPSTLGSNGPIAELPFKLVASPTKPQENSSQSTVRPTPSGRVAKTSHRLHIPSARPGAPRTTTSESVSEAPEPSTQTFNFALPGTTAPTAGGSSGAASGHAGFITPERLGANFSMFPAARVDLGKTPGGLAFKTTGRAPPGTPAVTTTLFGTEVSRDTRFADLPYDPDASRGSQSWEEGLPVWPAVIPRNTDTQ